MQLSIHKPDNIAKAIIPTKIFKTGEKIENFSKRAHNIEDNIATIKIGVMNILINVLRKNADPSVLFLFFMIKCYQKS